MKKLAFFAALAGTGAFAWLLTRRLVDPIFRTVLIPVFGMFGLMFGAWYVGLG
jgi:hypothetical protein